MTAETEKRIPAAYLRSQEFARRKRAHEQRERERREARRKRVTERLAAVLSDESKEVRMGEQHPGRLYIPKIDLEKFFDLLDKSRGGTVGQFSMYEWLSHKYPQTAPGASAGTTS